MTQTKYTSERSINFINKKAWQVQLVLALPVLWVFVLPLVHMQGAVICLAHGHVAVEITPHPCCAGSCDTDPADKPGGVTFTSAGENNCSHCKDIPISIGEADSFFIVSNNKALDLSVNHPPITVNLQDFSAVAEPVYHSFYDPPLIQPLFADLRTVILLI